MLVGVNVVLVIKHIAVWTVLLGGTWLFAESADKHAVSEVEKEPAITALAPSTSIPVPRTFTQSLEALKLSPYALREIGHYMRNQTKLDWNKFQDYLKGLSKESASELSEEKIDQIMQTLRQEFIGRNSAEAVGDLQKSLAQMIKNSTPPEKKQDKTASPDEAMMKTIQELLKKIEETKKEAEPKKKESNPNDDLTRELLMDMLRSQGKNDKDKEDEGGGHGMPPMMGGMGDMGGGGGHEPSPKSAQKEEPKEKPRNEKPPQRNNAKEDKDKDKEEKKDEKKKEGGSNKFALSKPEKTPPVEDKTPPPTLPTEPKEEAPMPKPPKEKGDLPSIPGQGMGGFNPMMGGPGGGFGGGGMGGGGGANPFANAGGAPAGGGGALEGDPFSGIGSADAGPPPAPGGMSFIRPVAYKEGYSGGSSSGSSYSSPDSPAPKLGQESAVLWIPTGKSAESEPMLLKSFVGQWHRKVCSSEMRGTVALCRR